MAIGAMIRKEAADEEPAKDVGDREAAELEVRPHVAPQVERGPNS